MENTSFDYRSIAHVKVALQKTLPEVLASSSVSKLYYLGEKRGCSEQIHSGDENGSHGQGIVVPLLPAGLKKI